MDTPAPAILFVDDEEENLARLLEAMKDGSHDHLQLIEWVPQDTEDIATEGAFKKQLEKGDVRLVVTDYDLTKSMSGFFGHSVVAWCQRRSIPVVEFSRRNADTLTREPSLFEFRMPTDVEKAATTIKNIFDGFLKIRKWLKNNQQVLEERRSLASVLAAILDSAESEKYLAPYMTRLGSFNAALLEKLKQFAGENHRPGKPNKEDKTSLLTYVLGHLLCNAILKYPGPILSKQAVAAYIASTQGEVQNLKGLLKAAEYSGPFSAGADFYWKDKVDEIIDELAMNLTEDDFESFGDYNRKVLESKLDNSLKPHNCSRSGCNGLKGGFWCPFTERVVCHRSDCSVPSSSWIPSGAQLCRVERDFYEEWAPLLGY